MGLRDDHKELTRRTVLAAVLDLLSEGSLNELSVPAVSRKSGVSTATIYRYFPTRDELLVAAANEPSRQVLAADHQRRVEDDDFAAFERAMWTDFSKRLALLRHQVASAAGRDLRQARLQRSRSQLADYIGQHGIDPTSPEGERLISMLLLVSGSLALLELHDRQDLDIETAIDTSLWATRALISASKPQPESRSVPREPSRMQRKDSK